MEELLLLEDIKEQKTNMEMVEDDLGATHLGGMIEIVIPDNIEEDLAPPMVEGLMITTRIRGTDIISLRTDDN